MKEGPLRRRFRILAVLLILSLTTALLPEPAVAADSGGGMDMVEAYCQNIPPVAYKLAERYWPGPLTMILEDKGVVPLMVTAETDTLGVRCPDHPLTLSILEKADFPLAATSANPAGGEPAKTAQEVLRYFDTKIEAVVDGGPCAVGVASTVLDLTEEEPKILREGGIPAQELLDFIRENRG